MLQWFKRNSGWVGVVARLVMGGVLLAAGLLKVADLSESVHAVRAYQLLPYELTEPVGIALPLIEIVIGVLLIVGLFTRISGILSSLLMAAFMIGIASAWARGLTIDCGCFGGGGEVGANETRYGMELLRDAGLLLAGIWVSMFPSTPLSLDRWWNNDELFSSTTSVEQSDV